MCAAGVQNDVIDVVRVRPIGGFIVNHLVSANGLHVTHVARAAHPRHMRAQGVRELHTRCAYRAGSAYDQNLLPRIQLGDRYQRLQGRACGHNQAGRCFVTHVVGNCRDQIRVNGQRVGAAALPDQRVGRTKHTLADLERRHAAAQSSDHTGKVFADGCGEFRPSKHLHDAVAQFVVDGVQAGAMHLDQHLARLRRWHGDIAQLHDGFPAPGVVHQCAHVGFLSLESLGNVNCQGGPGVAPWQFSPAWSAENLRSGESPPGV